MLNACWGLQAQREAAVRTGNFLDLTAEADVSDEALEAIRALVGDACSALHVHD
jgi:hypothetical protein